MNFRESRGPRECRVVGCHRRVTGASAFCKEHYLEWRNAPVEWPNLNKIKK